MQRHVTRHSETNCNRCSRSTPPFGVRCATVIGECPRTGAFRFRLGRLECGGSFVVHPPDVLAPSAVILHEAHRALEHTFPSNIADDATVHARRGGRHTRTDELIFCTNSSPSVVRAWHRTWMLITEPFLRRPHVADSSLEESEGARVSRANKSDRSSIRGHPMPEQEASTLPRDISQSHRGGDVLHPV
jgi:hypothetical protein